MSKGHSRRTRLCKGSRAATGSGVGLAKLVSRSTSKMETVQPPVDRVRGRSKRGAFSHLKLFVKPGKREVWEDSSSTTSTHSPDDGSTDKSSDSLDVHTSFRKKLVDVMDDRKWTVIQTRGVKPVPRFNHAAAVVGRKLLVIGGQTLSETRNDVQMLHLGKLSWAKVGVGDSAPSKGLPIKTGPAVELPNCRGHSLIAWGKTVILIGGHMDPSAEKVAVWSFDLEMDCWTTVVTKGEIPVARSGQTVTRAGSILIMFGGEDVKGRKLNDLNILDLKSLMWLPLNPTGKGPSPRSRHVADMYDDRFLFIFGGETKSKISGDIFALDFENMEWSKLKTKGIPPAPRAGHAGALVGSMWYIVGGESRVSGPLDTAVLDMSRMEWSVVAPARLDSVASLQGLSLICVQRKEKRFLVAFGGCGTQTSNAIQVLHVPLPDQGPRKTLAGLLELPTSPVSRTSSRSGHLVRSQQAGYPTLRGAAIPCACVSVVKTDLESVTDHRSSSQRSTSSRMTEVSADLDRDSGLIPLRTRYAMSQSARMDPLMGRSISHVSSFDLRRPGSNSSWESISSRRDSISSSSRRRDLVLPKLKDCSSPGVPGSEGSERQHQNAQRIRGDLQNTEITAPSVDSGLLSAEDLQITAPSVRPGLVSSVGDAGTLFSQTHASVSSRRRSGKGGSQSSEFSGYAETFVSGNGEGHNSEPSLTGSTSSVVSCSNMSTGSTGPSPNSTPNRTPDYDELRLSSVASPGYLEVELTVEDHEAAEMSNGTTPDMEEDEPTMLSKILVADSAEERSTAVAMLRRLHDRRLAAATRTGELLARQCAEALRDRDEAERTLHNVRQSRQRIEGRLGTALRQIKDLQDRLSVKEQALEKSSNEVHSATVENLKLEHDLALKAADLGESQKELQTTRGVLIAEGTRAFQLQVELIDLKHKLQSSNPRALLAPCMQQPILA